jgi:hypothetical protein
MTKKLLMVSLLAVLFMAGSVLADVDDTVYVWYFDPAVPGPATASPGKVFQLPVYVQCTENAYAADLHLPLAINDIYFDDIPLGDCSRDFYPFHDPDNPYDTLLNWDDASFLDTLETTPPNPAGWHSRSFAGWADLGGASNPWLYFTTPTQCLIFGVSAPIEDTLYLDQTICDVFQDGVSSTLGGPAAGDTMGVTAHTLIIEYPCVYFSPNQPPEFPEGAMEALQGALFGEGGLFEDNCGYYDGCVEFILFDADGDDLAVSANAGTIELIGTDGAPGEPTYYTYEWCFDMEDFCGECFSGELMLTINDGINDPVEVPVGPVEIIGEMTASMDTELYIYPGMEDWMPVYLDVCGGCFCLGGFKFTLEYDASVLTATDYMFSDALDGVEYTSVNMGQGWMNVVVIRDLNNQEEAPEICGFFQEPIFWVKFLLAPGEYPIGFCIPVCFMDSDDADEAIGLNVVSDEAGYHDWFSLGCEDAPDSAEYGTMELVLECGNIKILDPDCVVVGDLNLNGYPFEIGDAIVLANYLIDPDNNGLSLLQLWASDVNGDEIYASIADLIFMLNVINENPPGAKLMPLDVVAMISMPLEVGDNLEVKIASETSVGGALVSINHTGVELGVPVAEGMDLNYSDNGDVMTVLVYSMESKAFVSGTNNLFTVPVLSEGALSFGDVSASDNIGHLLDARSELTAPIPENFVVAQNFPNPFNARTTISFGLPDEASVSIAIYNVAGQLVETIDAGELSAGYHSVIWDASVASGVYFYKVTAGNFSETMKMTLLK